MKLIYKKICIFLAFVIASLCCNVALGENVDEKTYIDSKNEIGKKSILNVCVPYDVSFKIILLNDTDLGWISSDNFKIINKGEDDVIVKFSSIYYEFKDAENFISVDSEEEVKNITDKKAYLMKIECEGNVNYNTYTIKDTQKDDVDNIQYFLKSNKSKNGENIGSFKFTGAANPLSQIAWKDKDVTVNIKFSIYNADTEELLGENEIIVGTEDDTQETTLAETIPEQTTERNTTVSEDVFTETSTNISFNENETTVEDISEITTSIYVTTENTSSNEYTEENNNSAGISSGGSGSITSSGAIDIEEASSESTTEISKNTTNDNFSSSGSSKKDEKTSSDAIEVDVTEESTQTTTEESTENTTLDEITSETTTVAENSFENTLTSGSAIENDDSLISNSSIDVEKDNLPINTNNNFNNTINLNENAIIEDLFNYKS